MSWVAAGRASSAARVRRCRSARRPGGSACSIASRASSCRNATPPASSWSIPASTHSSRWPGAAPAASASSQVATGGATTAAASSTFLAGADSRAARASTASRTVTGISSPPAARTSVTKNGFPPVVSYNRSWSTPPAPTRAATASRDNGSSRRRRTSPEPARSPRATRKGWDEPTSSSRNVATIRTGRGRSAGPGTAAGPRLPRRPNGGPRRPGCSGLGRVEGAPAGWRTAAPEAPPRAAAPRAGRRRRARCRSAAPAAGGCSAGRRRPTGSRRRGACGCRAPWPGSSCRPRPHHRGGPGAPLPARASASKPPRASRTDARSRSSMPPVLARAYFPGDGLLRRRCR